MEERGQVFPAYRLSSGPNPCPGPRYLLNPPFTSSSRQAQRSRAMLTLLSIQSDPQGAPASSYSAMPTLGPSVLFAAGLAIGAGAGMFYPRKSPVPLSPPVQLPPPPPEGGKQGQGPISTPAGPLVLQGGFPGQLTESFTSPKLRLYRSHS